ncbi:hypothetical protein DICPUDRAFT_33907 [Dictyostelium purpureum]|uniref:Prefoldin subunit 2 n=1 Tax=Dictyostelium purpureum TaxID=5786 RepID=F0ZLP1_DICPU|nr:uncharacterized protein DICPUDRAFT_33907 [Dictyostelium purpureum]EGC35146.1 hypothetical protein DICPUDRAFT_33907 [Dictyostelium purpureum]|eukprot:XP_003288339.1 hypothetical protein DICPUDRAFT_33907 [Dictyostelium purpureum]
MASTSNKQPLTEEQIVNIYKSLKENQQLIMNKLSELETDASEHTLVINAVQGLEPGRKCFRMIGGVLTERTVGDVLPQIKQNRDGIKEAIKNLDRQLQEKTKELNDFIALYKIKVTQK